MPPWRSYEEEAQEEKEQEWLGSLHMDRER